MIKKFLLKDHYALLVLLFSFIISGLYSPWLIIIGIFILYLNGNIKFSKKGLIDSDFILLTFILLSYFAFAYLNNNVTIAMAVLRIVPSIMLYMLGYNLVGKNQDTNYWYFFLLVIALSTSFVSVYCSIDDTIKNGFIAPERMFGVNAEEFNYTTSLIASQLIPSIACIGLVFDNPCMIKNKKLKWFGFILGVLGELCAIHYVSRAGILIMAISIIIGLMYRAKFNFRTIVFVLITIFAFWLFMQSDAYTAFELKNEIGGDISTGNGRDERMLYWLYKIMHNPMGIVNWVNEYSLYPWAHNFWLDFTKECGIIPGMALVCFSLKNLFYVVCIAYKKNVNKSLAQLVLLLSVAYLLTLFTEPTMQGAPLLMFSYFMFCGAVKSIYKFKRNDYENLMVYKFGILRK